MVKNIPYKYIKYELYLLFLHNYSLSKMKKLLILFLFLLPAFHQAWAQDEFPSVDPSAIFINAEGEELDDATMAQSAPLEAHFFANPENVGGYSARYEWTITRMTQTKTEVIVHRFDENLDYTFTQSGTFAIRLYATFVQGNDTISVPAEGEDTPIMVSICESKLEFPNAFSPNGDGYNDTFHAKDGYQSIVSFKASIFNRWGQCLYSWDKLDGEWDGKHNGQTVNDGVYYLVVNAKGADGRKYDIRKAINVLTGYDNTSKTGGQHD